MYQELLDDNRRLREELRVAQQRIVKLERQVEELLRLVEKLRGEGKRQAAPFRQQDEPTARWKMGWEMVGGKWCQEPIRRE